MPFPISCPNCAAKLQVPDELSGKRLKCKKCGEAFVARPADDAPAPTAKPRSRPSSNEDDEPRRPARATRPRAEDESDDEPRARPARDEDDEMDEPRPEKKRKKKKAKTPVGLIVGVAIAAVLLIGGGIFAAIYFGGDTKPTTAGTDVARNADGSPKMPSFGGGGPIGKKGGNAGPNTWVEHVDAEGKYRIKFPGQPSVKDQTATINGMQHTAKTIQFMSGQQVYVTTASPVPPDANVSSELILQKAEEMAATQLPGATVTHKENVSHAGVDGRELTVSIQGGQLTGVIRIFCCQ